MTKVEIRVGKRAELMAMKMPAGRATKMAVNWVHSMAIQMDDRLAERMVLMRFDLAGG